MEETVIVHVIMVPRLTVFSAVAHTQTHTLAGILNDNVTEYLITTVLKNVIA